MGLLVKPTTGRGQARQLNWFGRGMSRMRAWENRHPVSSVLVECAPALGTGALAALDQSAFLLLTSGQAGIVAGGLLLTNIFLRTVSNSARRIDLEGKVNKLDNFPREEQLTYCYAILRDEKISRGSRIRTTEFLRDLGTIECFSMLVDIMDRTENTADRVTVAVFMAVAELYGKLDLKDEEQAGIKRSFDRRYVLSRGEANELWGRLLCKNKDKLMQLGPSALPVLRTALDHEDPHVRCVAAEMLGNLGDTAAVSALRGSLGGERVGKVVVEALGKIGDPATIPLLDKELRSSDEERAKAAAAALVKIGPAAIPALEEDLGARSGELRRDAARVLLKIGKFTSEFERNRVRAYIYVSEGDWEKAVALGSAAVPALESALRYDRENIKRAAAGALKKIGGPVAIPVLEEELRLKDEERAKAAAEALGKIGVTAIPALEGRLKYWGSGYQMTAAQKRVTKRVTKAVANVLLSIDEFTSESGRKRAMAYIYTVDGDWERTVALGPAAIPALEKALKYGEIFAAIEALGKICDPAAIPVLKGKLGYNDEVSKAAARALSKIGPAAVPALEEELAKYKYIDDSHIYDEKRAKTAAKALVEMGDSAALLALEKALEHDKVEVREVAAEALNEIGNPSVKKALLHWSKPVREAEVKRLGELGGPAAIPILKEALKDVDSDIIILVIGLLSETGDPAAIPGLERTLWHRDSNIRMAAMKALDKIGPPAISALEKALGHGDSDIREAAIKALDKIGLPAVSVLEKALGHEDNRVRAVAAEGLLRIKEFKSRFKKNEVRAYVYVGEKNWKETIALGAAAIPALEKMQECGDERVKVAVARALERVRKKAKS